MNRLNPECNSDVKFDYKKPIGPSEFEIIRPRDKNLIVSAADFGVSEENSDNRQAFMDAIDYCKKHEVSSLSIPKGIYHIRSGNLVFDGLEDFTVNGNGCELIFGKFSCLDFNTCITFNRCHRVVFKDIIMDWNWAEDPIGSRVIIANVDKNGEYLDLEFVDEELLPKEIVLKQIHPLNPETMSIGHEGKKELPQMTFQEDVLLSEDDRRRKPDNVEYIGVPSRIQHVNHNTRRAWVKPEKVSKERLLEINVGDYYLVRHYNFEIYGLYFNECTHFTISDCTVYSCPGIAFYVNKGHHFQNNNLKVTKRDGRYISSAADHYHVHNSNGYFKFDRCDFGYGGDDCLNIHDEMSAGVKKINERTIIALTGWKTPYEPGDLLEFRNEDLSPMDFSAKIVERTFSEDMSTCEILFDRDLPDTLQENTVLFWKTYNSLNYIIRDCDFHHNRARGLLLQTPNGLIENCRFYYNSSPAVIITTGYEPGKWCEGFGAENVIFRNNVFERMNHYADLPHFPAIYMGTYNSEGRMDGYKIFKDILFENNTFVNFPGVSFYVSSVKNMIILGNKFINTTKRLPESEMRGAICIKNASQISVIDNEWVGSKYMRDCSIYYDENNVNKLQVKGGKL